MWDSDHKNHLPNECSENFNSSIVIAPCGAQGEKKKKDTAFREKNMVKSIQSRSWVF